MKDGRTGRKRTGEAAQNERRDETKRCPKRQRRSCGSESDGSIDADGDFKILSAMDSLRAFVLQDEEEIVSFNEMYEARKRFGLGLPQLEEIGLSNTLWKLRSFFLEILLEVSKLYYQIIRVHSFHLAVNFLDRSLQSATLNLEHKITIALPLSCFLLACKYGEVQCPVIVDLLEYADQKQQSLGSGNIYQHLCFPTNQQHLRNSEAEIFTCLSMELHVVTFYDYIQHFQVLGAPSNVYLNLFSDLATDAFPVNRYPSLVVALAVLRLSGGQSGPATLIQTSKPSNVPSQHPKRTPATNDAGAGYVPSWVRGLVPTEVVLACQDDICRNLEAKIYDLRRLEN